jgi:hypothetical protein
MGNIVSKIRSWWTSLPHPVQAGIMLFGGAATGVVHKVLENPNACMSLACWKQYLASAAHAGVLAVIALYIPANLNPPSQS